MMISIVAGFVVGFLCLMIKSHLVGTDSENVWNIIDAIFFQDITATTSIEGIGLFYIIGQLFMHALQMMIVPLVLCSLSLALCSLADPKRLGKIAGKTFVTYLSFYVVAAALAAAGAYFVKTMGWFDVHLPNQQAQELVTMEGYNPLVTVVNAVPSNIISAMSTNSSILSVCVFAIIVGLGLTHMGEKGDFLKKVLENLNDIVQMFLNFLINKTAPVAIFCMITRALAVYGIEYIAPTLVWIAATIVISLLLVCTQELGCTKEISSFVFPTGMTINMNGTTAMHMIAITFIGTAAGIDVKPSTLALAAFLSICTAVGTPAIPVAGTTMVYVVMMGLGFNTELCLIGYSLVLAMNYLPGMAVITLNVIGDAATNVIVNAREGVLDKDMYNS